MRHPARLPGGGSRAVTVAWLAVLSAYVPLGGQVAERVPSSCEDDVASISRLLGDDYVAGVFVARDEAAVRRGFHADFRLFVLMDTGFLVVTLDEWLERLGLDGTPSPRRYEHRVTVLDCEGDAALARVDLWEDGRHRYVDFFSLYRFRDGWRIVSKTFQSPT